MKIVICLGLGITLFLSQDCRLERSGNGLPDFYGISAEDNFPCWSPDGLRIVFSSGRNEEEFDIFIMNADGTDPAQLTDNPSFESEPAFSPDGRKIAFSSNRDGNLEVYMMNADGSQPTRLTDNPANDTGASWSPDGSRIAFSSNRDGDWEIYAMDADGSNQMRLTDNTYGDGSPSWSPDGQAIAFVAQGDIWLMSPDGSNPMRLTDNSAGNSSPSWSPDGSKIIFASNKQGDWEIYAMDRDGSNQRRLTNVPSLEIYPSWSPDGSKIAFVSDRDFDREVYMMDADGYNPVNLTKNAPINGVVGLAPQPRREVDLDAIPYKIVFESYRETNGKENWEICMIDASGTNLINLTDTPEIDEMYPHASPDGGRICFVADEGKDRESKSRNIYIMKIDGTGRVKIAENGYQPCWSPDGKHIAYLPGEFPRYESYMRANKGLEIFDLETGKTTKHPNNELIHLARLCWSPDGDWFVVGNGRGGLKGRENAFKVDDRTMMRLSIRGCTPDISPDGKSLAWNASDWSINIGALDFDSPQRSVIGHKIVIACDRDHWVYHADWSPDNRYLAFSYSPYEGGDSQSRPAPGSNICICDLSTGKWVQVTADGKHNKEPDWVPVLDN
jgi:Tol biopolymer transport system component